MTRPPMLPADYITELTRGFTTRETVTQPTRDPHDPDGRWRTQTRTHTVHHAPLLTQIQQAVTGSTMGGQVFQAAYGSKPAARIDALAFLERIDRQSRAMATAHALPALPLVARLTRLAGVLGDRPNRAVKAWWTTARILTQHDGPPFAPDVPCPNEDCERWGSLRVRVEDRLAVCVECQDTWSEDTIADQVDLGHSFGRLAVWVEWASTHLRGSRHWVDDAAVTGYVDGRGRSLGYRVECPECRPERVAMAGREAARLVAVRARRADVARAS